MEKYSIYFMTDDDGKRMLMELLPIIIGIMMQQKDRDWGEIYFPVV